MSNQTDLHLPPLRISATAADPTSEQAVPPASPGQPAHPLPSLSPEAAALRDHLRRTLALLARQPFNTQDNTPGEILQLCLAFGCKAEVSYGGPSGARINAIGCLCWNLPCAGYVLLQPGDERPSPRVGYGLQEFPGQFLAVLAQSSVPANYEIRVGRQRFTVADLVEAEKLACQSGGDLSGTLIGLAYYVTNGQTWKNRLGETWSLERIMEHELDRKVAQGDRDAIDRLMGLSHAVARRELQGGPLEGSFARARKYLDETHAYALSLQNADGSWNPAFFARRGTSHHVLGNLRATGHIVEWLVFSLSNREIRDPRLVRSVAYLSNTLESLLGSTSVPTQSPRAIGAVMHAAHALDTYDRRVFRPFDPAKPLKAATTADTTQAAEVP